MSSIPFSSNGVSIDSNALNNPVSPTIANIKNTIAT
jgi:hypothetical protein